MTIFDLAYVLAGLALVAFELLAVWQAKHQNIPRPFKQTISRKVVNWIARKPKSRRLLVAVGLLWLTWHWTVQYF